MKYALLALTLICVTTGMYAQKLIFAENGSVFLESVSLPASNNSQRYGLDTVALKSWAKKQKDRFVGELKVNIEAALEQLDQQSGSPFAKWVLAGDTTEWGGNLRHILNNLKNKKNAVTDVTQTSYDYRLAKLIDSFLALPLYRIYPTTAPNLITYKLEETDIVSKFLGTYYDQTLLDPVNKLVSRTTMSNFYNYYYVLKLQYDNAEKILEEVFKKAEPATIEKLYLANLAFTEYKNRSDYIKLLRLPFYRQWLWSTGGVYKLHPLDAAAAIILDTAVGMNLLTEAFTKEKFLNRNKRLIEANGKTMQQLSFPDRVVNRLDIPVEARPHCIGPFGDKDRNQYYMINTRDKWRELPAIRDMDDNEKIYIQLLNVDKGYKVRHRIISTETLSGLSPTEEILDTVARGALSIYNLLTQNITGILGVVGMLNPVRNNDAPVPINFEAGQAIFGDPANKRGIVKINRVKPAFNEDDFWDNTEQLVKILLPDVLAGNNSDFDFYKDSEVKKIGFNQDIFDKLRRIYKLDVERTIKGGKDKEIKALQEKIIGTYFGKMYALQVAPIFIKKVRTDSLYLAQLIHVFNCTMPVRPFDTQTDTVPTFRSELVTIAAKENNKKHTILIEKINTNASVKDSSDIVSFTFKKVKRSLVEVSFGLSYTVGDVWLQQLDKNTVSVKKENWRGIAAIHFYPFRGKNRSRPGLYKVGEPFFGSWNRVNFLIGMGIPKPLDNYYLGIGYDFGPGLKLSTGVHLHKIHEYKSVNNIISSEETYFKTYFPFVSLSLNPALVMNNIIAVFKKS